MSLLTWKQKHFDHTANRMKYQIVIFLSFKILGFLIKRFKVPRAEMFNSFTFQKTAVPNTKKNKEKLNFVVQPKLTVKTNEVSGNNIPGPN